MESGSIILIHYTLLFWFVKLMSGWMIVNVIMLLIMMAACLMRCVLIVAVVMMLLLLHSTVAVFPLIDCCCLLYRTVLYCFSRHTVLYDDYQLKRALSRERRQDKRG